MVGVQQGYWWFICAMMLSIYRDLVYVFFFMGGDEAGVRMASARGRVELLNKMQMHATPHYHLNSIMLFCDIFTEYILINSTGEPRNEHDRTRRQLSHVTSVASSLLQASSRASLLYSTTIVISRTPYWCAAYRR